MDVEFGFVIFAGAAITAVAPADWASRVLAANECPLSALTPTVTVRSSPAAFTTVSMIGHRSESVRRCASAIRPRVTTPVHFAMRAPLTRDLREDVSPSPFWSNGVGSMKWMPWKFCSTDNLNHLRSCLA